MPTSVGTYPVMDDLEVRLEVEVSEGGEGQSSATIGGIGVGFGDPIHATVGRGRELRGQLLVVSTTVLDRRPAADWTSVTVRLRSGAVRREYGQKQLADTGGVVSYLTVITFV